MGVEVQFKNRGAGQAGGRGLGRVGLADANHELTILYNFDWI